MSAFLIQLGMYLTPVIYPMANLEGQMLFLMKLNPVASVIECFRHSFLGIGIFDWQLLGYAAVVSFFVFMLSIFVFQKTQKRFVDTI
ncbi:MAG: hypothetical protein MI748_09495 [Opitutales bacterium]|nr:hypothetical protein [Opitutales bacterium]